MLLSSGSEICLRVMKVCSPSVLLLCLGCLSMSLSLLGTHKNTHHQRCTGKRAEMTQETSLTALWVAATG